MKKSLQLLFKYYLVFLTVFFLSFTGIAVAQETETEENFEVVETEKEDIEVNENKDDESELKEESDKEKDTDEVSKKNKSSVLSAKSALTSSADEEELPEVQIDKKVVPHTNLSSGTASYGVSIEVPPGRNGLTPEVSLSYNSGSGNGFLGIGWALSYGGEIKRSTKRGLNYSDNKFEINGNELISINGSSTDYREKIESGFSKYYYNTANKSWTVTLRDGTKYYYGSETQSRQEKSGSEIFKWCLDKVVDTNGNYIQIVYYKDQNQIYPEEIKYTGNLNSGVLPQNSIKFVKDTVSRPDSFFSYTLKTKVVTAKRLKSVKVYGNGEFVRRYNLTYDTAPHTGRSRITKIEEFGDDNSSKLPEKNFVWENGNNSQFSPNNSYVNELIPYGFINHISFMDMNGDGYADRVYNKSSWNSKDPSSSQTNIGVNLNLRNGTFNYTFNTDIFTWGNFISNRYNMAGKTSFGDMDGDGLKDLIITQKLKDPNFGDTFIYLNQGDGKFSQNHSYRFSNILLNMSFMDINGDGYVDMVYDKSTFNSKNPSSSETLIGVNLNQKDGTFKYTFNDRFSWPSGFQVTKYNLAGKINYGDMNGDGLQDLLINKKKRAPYNNQGETLVYLNQGDGKFSQNHSYRFFGPNMSYMDMNGDGYVDMVSANSSRSSRGFNTTINVNLNQRDGTFRYNLDLNNFPFSGYFPNSNNYNLAGKINFGDMNGDGLQDLIIIHFANNRSDYGNRFTFLNQNNYKQDLLTKVKLGPTIDGAQSGATIDIAYKIPPRSTKMFPFFNPVVDTLTINDGIKSSSSVTKYDYLNGYYKGTERESRGFEKVTQTNPDGTILDTWYYQEDDYLKGQAIKTEFKKPDGSTLLSSEIPTWSKTALSGGGQFIKIDSKKSSVTNGNTKVETKEEYTYNLTNGFVETVTSSLLSDNNGDEITSEKVYENTGEWLWRLSEEILYKKNSKTEVLSKTTYSNFDSRGNHRLETYYNDISDDSTKSITYDPDYGFVTDEYDSDNKLIYHADYDSTSTYVKSIRNTLGHTTAYEYSKFGQISKKTDPNGNISRFLYDTFGRVVTVYNDGKPGSSDYKDGSGITYEYQDDIFPQCVVTKIHSTDDNKIDQYDYYDGLNRKIQTSGAGEFVNDTSARRYIISKFHYDNMGRSWLAEGPFFSVTNTPDYSSHNPKSYPVDAYPWTETTFDYLGQPLSQSSRTSGEFITTSYSYDGLEKTVTDPDGKSIKQITNYLGKIIQVVEAPDDLNYNTYYTYNAAGEVVNIKDNENKNIVFKFDSLGRKYEMIDPDLGTIQYSYNKNNTLHTQTDAKNNIIEFEYDDLKRVTKKKYLSTSDKDVVYTYDLGTNGIGKLYSVSNSDVTNIFNGYDKSGNCLQETKTIGSKTYVSKYAFDITGKPSDITYPNNYKVIYQYYTGTNLLKLVQGDSGVHVEYSSYEPTGKIGQLVFGNEAKTSYTYNPYTTRLETFLTTVPEGSGVKNLQSKRYEYTAAGDIKTIADNVAGSMSTYTYDQLHRLLSESTYGGKPSILKNSVLTFEHTGETGIPHHAPKSISLNSQPLVTMVYDKNGNMTGSFDFTSLTGFHNRSITYNGDNMPLSINHGNNGITTFLYDGTAKRARKSHNGKSTYYINKISEERDNQITNYIFGGNLRIAKIKGTETFYYHKDHLGSTTVLTDNAVNPGDDVKVIETAQYAPYGMEKTISADSSELNYKFTDQEKDKSTGLYNYDARLYDPVIGIFVSADTVLPDMYDPQSLNRYSYCRNNPLIYTDPSGHIKITTFSGGTASGGCLLFGGEGAMGYYTEYNITWSGIETKTGKYSSVGLRYQLGLSGTAGWESGVMFGGKESLVGRTMSIGGSGGILFDAGVDALVADDIYGFSFSYGVGGGAEGHIGILEGYDSWWGDDDGVSVSKSLRKIDKKKIENDKKIKSKEEKDNGDEKNSDKDDNDKNEQDKDDKF